MDLSPLNTRDPTRGAAMQIVTASSLDGLPVPPRHWLAEELIPDRTVTLLGGDGGTGKSLLALQLAVAVVTGTDWLKSMPVSGDAVYLSAEDDIEELHRRLDAITRGIGHSLADLDGLHLIPLAGKDALLAAPHPKNATIVPRPLWVEIRNAMEVHHPKLVVLDTLADLFGGDENNRAQARQFIGLLRGLAIEFECAVLVLAHPSLTGLASGTGSSGSTGWSNSVRSRLYFERVKVDRESEPDPDLRRLKLMKSNYGQVGTEIMVRWKAGMFRLDLGGASFDKMATDSRTDDVFLDLLAQFDLEGRAVSDKPSASWAPKQFAAHPKANGIGRKAFEAALNRLFAAGKIRVETVGPPSRQTRKLSIVADAS